MELSDAHKFIGHRYDHALPLLDQTDLGTPRDPDRKLRIGLMSPDFRAHSVAYFARPYLAAFDQDAFDVYAYASVAEEDEVSDDLSRLATSWKNIFHLDDRQLAETIRDDRIDILVDLAGLTKGTRLLTMTARPAPIQMTYIGYPNTTGLSAVDYRITDWIADPEGTDDDYCETLIRLPDCFSELRDPEACAADRPLSHRQEWDHVTFGSFNNFAKVNADVLALWAEILKAVPGSRLLFKSTSSNDATAQQTIRGCDGELWRRSGTHRLQPVPRECADSPRGLQRRRHRARYLPLQRHDHDLRSALDGCSGRHPQRVIVMPAGSARVLWTDHRLSRGNR